MTFWARKRRIGLVLLALSLLAYLAIAWLVGGMLIAPHNYVVGPPPKNAAWTVESMHLQGASGPIATWLVDHPKSEGCVLLLHPRHGDRRHMLSRAALLYNAGYSIVMIDLQANGESPGQQSTLGLRESGDVRVAVTLAKSRWPGQRIGIVGRSLGGAAALLGGPLEIDALVLESVYGTIEEAAKNRVRQRLGASHSLVTPALLMQLPLRLGIHARQLRPIEQLPNARCPVLVAAGALDRHTTLAETKRLFNAALEPKELVVFPDAAHIDLLQHDPKLYRDQVLPFLARYLKSPAR